MDHWFGIACIVVAMVTVQCGDDRRLLLHSETDIAQEVEMLRHEVDLLKAELKGRGSTYIRWGRTLCDGNDTEKVYSGFTAGSMYNRYGGPANTVCLPESPTWGKYVDGIQGFGAYIHGSEYEESSFHPFPQNMANQDAPCVLCHNPRSVTVMIPGRINCYPGWELEYTGYLMTTHHSHNAASSYVCVDTDPEAIFHGEADQNGHLLYFTEAYCGSLPCQEYPQGREIACVVCSK